MGSKNPDRIRPPPSPEQALTLAEIHLQRWELMATCAKCSTRLRANLATMIKVWGPDEIWWGRQPCCPVWDCTGRLAYVARAVNGGTWTSMRSPAPPRVLELWKAKNGRDDRGPR